MVNKVEEEKQVHIPITLYLMMFLQLLMTGYVAILLRDGLLVQLI